MRDSECLLVMVNQMTEVDICDTKRLSQLKLEDELRSKDFMEHQFADRYYQSNSIRSAGSASAFTFSVILKILKILLSVTVLVIWAVSALIVVVAALVVGGVRKLFSLK